MARYGHDDPRAGDLPRLTHYGLGLCCRTERAQDAASLAGHLRGILRLPELRFVLLRFDMPREAEAIRQRQLVAAVRKIGDKRIRVMFDASLTVQAWQASRQGGAPDWWCGGEVLDRSRR